jgi:hypothetical protein
MQRRGRKAPHPRFVQQVGFDGGLVFAVRPEGTAWLLFAGRHHGAGAVDPDGAAMQEMPHLTAQGLDQVPCAGRCKADHVDNHLSLEFPDVPAKRARCFFLFAIQRQLSHRLPGAMCLIGGALPAADLDDLVAGFD